MPPMNDELLPRNHLDVTSRIHRDARALPRDRSLKWGNSSATRRHVAGAAHFLGNVAQIRA